MLTIKQITENTEEVIRGLEKKHFKDAKATIEQVLAFNDKRRSTQNQLDKNLAEVNSLSKSYRDWETDRKSTRLNSSHITRSRMPSSA